MNLQALVLQKLIASGHPHAQARFQHSLGVANQMVALCEYHKCPLSKEMVFTTGLVHDYAKYTTYTEWLELGKAYPAMMLELKAPKTLLHALCGPYLIAHELGLTDPELLEAVKFHATGKPRMSLLTELLFVCDYTEESRHGASFDLVRKLSKCDLPTACFLILTYKIIHILHRGYLVYPLTLEAYEAYQQLANYQLFDKEDIKEETIAINNYLKSIRS